MEYEFDVKMTTSALYDFNMHYTYSSPSGIIGTAAGALFLFVFTMTHQLYFLAAGVVIILYLPFSLYSQAARQVKLNPVYKHPLHVKMTDEGVTVSQGEGEISVEWQDCLKATSTNKSIMIYTSRKSAWIFPATEIKDHRARIIEIISTHMPPEKVKIRQ